MHSEIEEIASDGISGDTEIDTDSSLEEESNEATD